LLDAPPVQDSELPLPPPVSLSLDDLLADGGGVSAQHSSHATGSASFGARKGKGRGKASPSAADSSRAAMVLNFAFATLLVGGLAIGLFWIAFVGLGLGLLGLVIGAIGFAAASSRQKMAVQLYSAGVALSLLGIGLGGYWSFTHSGAKSDVALADAPVAASPATMPDGGKAESTTATKKLAVPTPSAQKAGDLTKHDPTGKSKPPRGDAKPVGVAKTPRAPGKTADAGVGLGSAAGSTPAGASPDSKNPGAAPGKDGQTPATPKGPPHNEVAKTGSIPIYVQDPSSKTADGADSTGSTADPAMTPDRATPAAAPIVWADGAKGEAQNNDDLEVSIAKVTLGPAVLAQAGATNELLAQTRETAQPFLTIWIKIKNAQLAGATEYHGWISQPADGPDAPKLVDDQGKALTQMPMEKGMVILNGHPSGTINAGDSLQDALIFKPPGEGVQSLRLTLPGKVLGTTGTYHFQIPMSMATSGLSTNPLLPSQ
jgi:hypothetical protein